MHDTLTIGIPVLAILAGILFNRQDVARLEVRIESQLKALEAKMDHRFDGMQADVNTLRDQVHREFREFYRTLGQHDARLDSLDRGGK